MRADKMKGGPVRMLLTGYPGSGKTGALASLVNAGYKLRIIDFDGNPESLIQYADADKLANVDIVSLEDKIGDAGDHIGVKGVPTAFIKGLKLLDSWKYKDGDEEIDLGKSSQWGTDTIVVLDGLTGLGTASMARAMAMLNKSPSKMSQPTWGLAINEQEAFIKRLMAADNPHHTIVISHLKIVGPKTEQAGDSDLMKEVKQAQGEIIPTRLYPSALGWQLPQNIAQHFPVVVNIRVAYKGKSAVRRFDTYAREEMDIKMPTKVDLGDLQVEDGLARIFVALGHKPPSA